jgi:Rrf2 family protein
MTLSRSAAYAIAAVAYIAAQPAGQLCGVHEISADRGIPLAFLEKILQTLRRRGLLRSVRGSGGGYQLAIPADRIHLIQILDPFSAEAEPNRCLLHIRGCSQENPCLLHQQWADLRRQLQERLERTTVADLVGAARKGGEAA